MKKILSHLFVIFAFVLLSSSFAAEPTVLVDTKFDQVVAEKNLLKTVKPSLSEPQLPFATPSQVTMRGTATIQGGTEDASGIKPPFALFKGTEDAKSGGELQWDLRGLMLKSGRYALSCKVTPQEANIDGFILQLVLSGEDGAWQWPQKRPLCISAAKGEITTDEPTSAKASYAAGTTLSLLIEFDMDALTWSASVDGKPLLPSTSFKQMYTPGSGLIPGGIFIRNSWKSIAVSNMKLEKLAERSEPCPERLAEAQLPRISWVGDSITQGYGLGNSDKKSPPGVLRTLLGGKFVVGNFGVSGTTLLKNGDSSYWKQDAFIRAKRFEPNIVIIMLGTNDSKTQNWAHSSEIAGDMAALVTEFKNLPSKPEVIVVMPVPVVKTAFGITEEILAQVRPLLAEGAKQAGATVVESASTMSGQEKLFPDGVHPNDKGAEIIAQLVANNLPAQKKTP